MTCSEFVLFAYGAVLFLTLIIIVLGRSLESRLRRMERVMKPQQKLRAAWREND